MTPVVDIASLLLILVSLLQRCSTSERVNCQQNGQTSRGHLKPLGHQNEVIKEGIDELFYTIPARTFFRQYLTPRKPVVFRGVIGHSMAMKNWIEDSYMKNVYGSVNGVVDRRTTWLKGGVEAPPRSVMNYSDFLDRLPHEQLYWDDRITDGHVLLEDMPLALFFDCKELRKTVLYINFMVNSGNVSYVLHSDTSDNLFHFIAGSKRWLIANSSFKDSLYIGNHTENSLMSPVVPDRVDLIKFPLVSKVIFREVILEPGDILYIPSGWPHYVQSSGFPNIALNVWFDSKDMAAASLGEPTCRRQHVSANSVLSKRMRGKTPNE